MILTDSRLDLRILVLSKTDCSAILKTIVTQPCLMRDIQRPEESHLQCQACHMESNETSVTAADNACFFHSITI
jgi:hypothetical protein